MYKIKNSDIPFLTLSKENFFTICNSLEYDEIGIIFKAFMDYVYFGIEPTFEKKYMRGIFDGVLQTMERKAEGCFASRENGKKGGRPKKNNTDLQPNTDFEEKAENSPNKPEKTTDDIVIPQDEESASEAPKQGEFDNTEERFNNTYSERLEKYIYQNQNEIKHNIDVIARYESDPNTIYYMTIEKEKARISKMISYLGVGTKDSIDLEDLYNSEIERATAAIIYQKAMR